jgi:pimeloyl-ACP methyl ester carboxylesterase
MTNDMTSFLERPGGRIAYDDSGGSGRLLVAVPGMGDTRGVYRHLAPLMKAAGFRFVAMDLRGLGESSVGWDDVTDAAVASDIVALIDHLRGGPAVVIGNSMSAASAVIAATNDPDKVAGLVLIGPFARRAPVKWWQSLTFRVGLLPPWGRSIWLDYYRDKLYPDVEPPDLDDHVARLRSNLKERGRLAAFRKMSRNSHEESGKRLGRVRQPTLVVMGALDPDFPDPQAEARAIADATKGEVLMVRRSGHYPQADNPARVGTAIVAFTKKAFRS